MGEAEERLKQFGLEKIYNEIELPLTEVLDKMKETGVKLDQKKIKQLLADYNKKIKQLEKKIYKAAGGEFNINSPKQLVAVLSDKFGISLRSTRAEVLQGLRANYPIADLVLQYR